ncbi:hypothetical protein RFI_33267 [Reticulomyxa filosa]|uniref:Uncharacterized protein n=1 Tax=Reticulomyxa filosa TaxID=46433 RepID=X6LTS6_RETFI|nr:hypothetical protein RFI_33267 [Reticulomyxa filosa]|eukprot:ETO04135.1 hypothetical protein RFI_33267 [Reticulomyxa filosa]
MWNHQIDANLIYAALNCFEKDVNLTIQLLFKFEQWKFQNNNEQKYKERANEFLEKRCCSHNINLLLIFISNDIPKSIKLATSITYIGLPFVKKDKDICTKNKKY